MDGRIGPGSIPAALQGSPTWRFSTQWPTVSEPDAPVSPVWQCAASGVLRETSSPYIAVKPGQSIAWSAWFRATTPGASPSPIAFLAGTGRGESNSVFYPWFLVLAPSGIPTAWTFYRGLWVVPAGYASLNLRITCRASVLDGVYQFCGAQMSIVGAMPVP